MVCYGRLILVPLLGGEQAWTPNFYLKSFDMDSDCESLVDISTSGKSTLSLVRQAAAVGDK